MRRVYLLLGTNLGARLGFLVTLAGLGWMFLMGIIWAVYGIGLRGVEPSWDAVPGRTVLQDTAALYQAGVFDQPVEVPEGLTYLEEAALVADEFLNEVGGDRRGGAELRPGSSAAGVFLEETGAFAAGEFQAVNVFDTRRRRALLIAASTCWRSGTSRTTSSSRSPPERARTEAGQASAAADRRGLRQHQYVYMVRNLGTRRQPAFVLTIGAGLIFHPCWLLHRRERVLTTNRSTALVPADNRTMSRRFCARSAVSQYLLIVVLFILAVVFGAISS